MKNTFTVISIGVALLVTTGCAQIFQARQAEPAARLDIQGEVRGVSDAEAEGFVKAQSTPVAHRPKVKVGPFLVRKGESLLSVANRLGAESEFAAVVFDLSKRHSPDGAIAKNEIRPVGGDTILGEIAAAFDGDIPGLSLLAAEYGEGQALVVTDGKYPEWQKLRVFYVQEGTLKSNAAALARSIGWELDTVGGWHAEDYRITSSYPIIIAPGDGRQAMAKLLDVYPTQAQMNPNTRSITVVPRLQPIRN